MVLPLLDDLLLLMLRSCCSLSIHSFSSSSSFGLLLPNVLLLSLLLLLLVLLLLSYFFKSLTTHEHVASSIFRKEKEKGYHPSLPPSPSPAFLEEKGQAEIAEGKEGGKEEEWKTRCVTIANHPLLF